MLRLSLAAIGLTGLSRPGRDLPNLLPFSLRSVEEIFFFFVVLDFRRSLVPLWAT